MIPEFVCMLRLKTYQMVIALVLLCVCLQYTGLADTLAYRRSLIANGDWWLLLSGNFVHLGTSHLWMNMAGFVLVVLLVWPVFSATQWIITIITCSLGVGVGLWFFNPDVSSYVGYSGTLHGLIIAGSLADLRRFPKSAALLLVLVVGKLVWEQVSGALPGSESVAGGKVLVDAHMYGAIAGGIVAALMLLVTARKQISDETSIK